MIFNKVFSDSQFTLYSAKRNDLPENTFIISSVISREILYNPHIAGKKLQDLMEKMSVIFINAAKHTALKNSKLSNTCELVYLSGGLYYSLNFGVKQIYGEVLPQCFLGIKRSRIEGQEGKFAAYATYENFESLPNNATVLVGDTIATGATLKKGLQHLFDSLEEKNYYIDKLIIFTLAGSTTGAILLKDLEQRLKTQFPNAKLYFFACEELFHLMPDGTDLRFIRETSLAPEETNKYTLETYGQFLGKEMKCAVFDWGTRCKNPLHHYKEFLEFCSHILKDKNIDSKGKAVIEKMKSETEKSIYGFDRVL